MTRNIDWDTPKTIIYAALAVAGGWWATSLFGTPQSAKAESAMLSPQTVECQNAYANKYSHINLATAAVRVCENALSTLTKGTPEYELVEAMEDASLLAAMPGKDARELAKSGDRHVVDIMVKYGF